MSVHPHILPHSRASLLARALASPRLGLRKKYSSQDILWNLRWEKNFEALKKAITSIHVLKVIDLRVNGIILSTNVNDLAIGVVLM